MNAPVKAGETVRVVDVSDPQDLRRIEDFVADARGSLFHRPAWLSAVQVGTGQRAAGLVSERMGIVTGWLPLTEVRSALFGKALVSSGFGVGGGPQPSTEPGRGGGLDGTAEAEERDNHAGQSSGSGPPS